MRVLVFGDGSMGRRHEAAATALGHTVAVYDPLLTPERTEREALDGFAPDAVVIAAPASEHWRLLALTAPLPAFVEKPLALSAVGLVAPVDRFVRIGYNWRFHPLVDEFCAKTAGFAAPAHVVLWSLSDMGSWPGAGYGDVLAEFSHEIDLALDLFGPATLVGAERVVVAADGTPRVWRLTLKHAAGTTAVVWLGDDVPEGRGLTASYGSVVAGYEAPPADPQSREAVAASYVAELTAFFDELSGLPTGARRLATIDDGIAVLRICDAARAWDASADARA